MSAVVRGGLWQVGVVLRKDKSKERFLADDLYGVHVEMFYDGVR